MANPRRNYDAPMYQNLVQDNLAYDMSHQIPEPQRYSTAPELERPRQPKKQTQPQKRAVAVQAPVMVVAPAAVILFAVMVAIWIFALQVMTRISTQQTEICKLEATLSEVQETQDDLLIAYETAYNFAELEDYAANTLGMQRPREEQSFYFASTASDQAVAVLERSRPDGLVDRFSDFLADLTSYFS